MMKRLKECRWTESIVASDVCREASLPQRITSRIIIAIVIACCTGAIVLGQRSVSLDPAKPGVIFIEAESGVIESPMIVENDEDASGGRYIVVPNETGLNTGGCTFTFDIKDAGDHIIFARLIAEDSRDDSIFVSMDNSAPAVWDVQNSHTWSYDCVRERIGEAVDYKQRRTFTLGKGRHSLTLKSREDGLKIDAVLIVRKDPGYEPSTVFSIVSMPLPLGQPYEFGNTPPYVPETNLPGVSEEKAFSVLNIRDFGAVGDGTSHPLREKYKSQNELDARYGKGNYLLDDERDLLGLCEAIRYARAYRYIGKATDEKVSADLSWKKEYQYGSSSVYMPSGQYIINRTVKIQDFRGFTLSGAGRGWLTVLYFTKPEPLFWVQYAGTLAFRDFTITAGTEHRRDNRSTGFYIVNSFLKDPNSKGRPSAFQIRYDNIGIVGFYQAVDVAGTDMGDTQQFYSCRFIHNAIALHLRNAQAMSLDFFGCDWWGMPRPENTGRATAFLVEAGGHISVFGGAMIGMGSALKLRPNRIYSDGAGGGPSINRSNGKFNINNVRFEWDKDEPLLFDAVDDGTLNAQINIENCVVWKKTSATKLESPLGVLCSGMNVNIRNISIPNNTNAVILGNIQGFTEQRRGVLIIDNVFGDQISYAETDGIEKLKTPDLWRLVRSSLITAPGEWKHAVDLRALRK
ncbi:MAG: hypothetical protein AABZ39_03315 [Spirochaetota bacterium]